MKHFLTFGLPVGSALVFLALINSIFLLHSIENFAEVLITNGFESANGDGFYTVSLIVRVLMAISIWVFVIIKGSRSHLSFWLGVYLVIVLIQSVIFVQSMFSRRNSLFLFSLWNLMVSIVIDFYLICAGIKSVNLMWKSYASPQGASYLEPVGSSFEQILRFYSDDSGLTARLLLMLDITWSAVQLMSIKIPALIFRNISEPEYFEIPILNTIDDVYLRLLRVVLSLIGFRMIVKQSQPSKLKRILFGHLLLTGISALIYFLQFSKSESFSVSETFERGNSLIEMMFRLVIALAFLRHIEMADLSLNNNFPCGMP